MTTEAMGEIPRARPRRHETVVKALYALGDHVERARRGGGTIPLAWVIEATNVLGCDDPVATCWSECLVDQPMVSLLIQAEMHDELTAVAWEFVQLEADPKVVLLRSERPPPHIVEAWERHMRTREPITAGFSTDPSDAGVRARVSHDVHQYVTGQDARLMASATRSMRDVLAEYHARTTLVSPWMHLRDDKALANDQICALIRKSAPITLERLNTHLQTRR